MRDYSKLDYNELSYLDFEEITEEQAEQLKANELISYWEYIDNYVKHYNHGYCHDYEKVLLALVREEGEEDLLLHFIIKEG